MPFERKITLIAMEVRHMRTFVAIAEAGALTRAAERLFKTQGAVSNDVKALEQSLGVELIDRSGQRVKLTTAGAALLRGCPLTTS